MAKAGSFFVPDVADRPSPKRRETQAATTKEPKRGAHLISGLFPPEVWKQYGMLAAELGVDKRALLADALNLVFEKHGKKPIAR